MVDESKDAGPPRKTKKAVKDVSPAEPKAVARPTAHEVREGHKADLVAWCEAFGLDGEGKVDDLRKRLLAYLETEAKAEAKPQARPPEAKPEGPEPKKAPAKATEEEAEPEYVVKIKPKLDPRTRALLRLRAEKTAQRPSFRRQEWFRYDKFGEEWRKPQGGQSKLRRHFGYRWNLPSIGYRGPREVRGYHPSGFQEVLVHNVRELEGVDPARQAVRIAHGVGTRKREIIEKACEERKLRVLNRMVTG